MTLDFGLELGVQHGSDYSTVGFWTKWFLGLQIVTTSVVVVRFLEPKLK